MTKQQELIRDIYFKATKQIDSDWLDIIDKYGLDMHPDSLRKMGAGIKLAGELGMLSQNPEDEEEDCVPPFKETEIIRADGSRESSKILTLLKSHDYTEAEILELHGFFPAEDWVIIEKTTNIWNGMTGRKRNNELVELYQSKVRAKPRADELRWQDIDEYMENKVFKHQKPMSNPLQYDPNGEVLEICLPDFHGGLLAWSQETGEDYDIHIAQDLFFRCFYDIVDRCKGRKFKKIVLVTLGDLCHIDNDMQTTTKGTFQQSDGRISKIADAIMDMLIEGITILIGDKEHNIPGIAPVEVIYIPGNHDRVTGRMIMMAVCKAFRKDQNVTFDMSPNPMKYIEIGCNLIGYTHGDMPVKNMDKWLQVHAREAWGRCKFAEVHQGHTHAQKVKEGKYITNDQTLDQGGIVVRTLPVICNSSYWEHQQGYAGATKAMMCFVWNEKTGLREMWYSCS